IKDFDDTAAGMYMCKVTFDNNVVEGFVDAQIFVPDTIIQVLLDVSSESVNVGDRAWFDCKVTGDPSAVISWSKEGADELPDNSQVTGGRLLFNEVTEDNAGVYKCRAKTKAGPLETRTVLNIGSEKRKRKHTRGRLGTLPVVKSIGDE
ncbi:immunoglobulin domain protein, partial [Teladorsagia circumcincta]